MRTPAKALIEAKLDSLYTPIFEATSGIVFLGTPHKGSTVANLGSIAANAVRYSGMMSINARLLQRLKKHNDFLLEKLHYFSRICSGFKIYTFYETIKTKGVMVPTSSLSLHFGPHPSSQSRISLTGGNT